MPILAFVLPVSGAAAMGMADSGAQPASEAEKMRIAPGGGAVHAISSQQFIPMRLRNCLNA